MQKGMKKIFHCERLHVHTPAKYYNIINFSWMPLHVAPRKCRKYHYRAQKWTLLVYDIVIHGVFRPLTDQRNILMFINVKLML